MKEIILTATGTSDSVKVFGEKVETVEFTVLGLTGTAVVSVEGKVKNGWVNLDENGSTSITADGTYLINVCMVANTEIRFNWESGSATSITAVFNFS